MDSKALPWFEWQRQSPVGADKICIDNLQISTDGFPDSFGRRKTQPALISVALFLRQQFQSAAEKDALDQSTINYGSLSKDIRDAIEGKAKAGELLDKYRTWRLIEDVIPVKAIGAFETDLFFPKACMMGDGIGFKKSMITNQGLSSAVIYFKNIRIPALIGVNAHERQSRQPIIANVWLDDPKEEIEIPLHVRSAEKCIVEVRPLHP